MTNSIVALLIGVIIGHIIVNRINPLYAVIDKITGAFLRVNRGLRRLFGQRKCEGCDHTYSNDKFCKAYSWKNICFECRDSIMGSDGE